MLKLVWLMALLLTAGAVLWMNGLILARLFHARKTARLTAERRGLESALIGILRDRTAAGAALAPYRHQARLIAETLLDFMSVVRGQDRQRVLNALEAEGVADVLRGRTTRGSFAGRLAAVESLVAFPGPETERVLVLLTEDRDPQLRFAAMQVLAEIGGCLSLDDVLGQACVGRLPVSGRVAQFLRARIAADPAAGLEALSREDLPPSIRALLLEALGASGHYAAIPRLQEHANHPDPDVRAEAVRAMGRLQHPAAEPAIAAALADPAWEVRAAAAEAAGGAHLASLCDRLGAALADPSWAVRFQAAAALGKLGARGMERLKAALAEPDSASGRTASLMLAELGVA